MAVDNRKKGYFSSSAVQIALKDEKKTEKQLSREVNTAVTEKSVLTKNYIKLKIIELKKDNKRLCTANEGPVRIRYKCWVPIYVFPEMKLCCLVISKTELECSVSLFPPMYL
jgi:hypothetical protein